MSDVFISYSSKDRDRARALAQALTQSGLKVWWDREIPTGGAFDEVIERELNGAKAVVVLWSKDSVASEWVKNEAAEAATRGVLLPATIDGTRPPLEFRRKQTADLSSWQGDPSHEGFQALIRGIGGVVGNGPLQAPQAVSQATTSAPRSHGKYFALAAIGLVVLLAIGYLTIGGKSEEPAIVEVPQESSAAAVPEVKPDASAPAPNQSKKKPASTSPGGAAAPAPRTEAPPAASEPEPAGPDLAGMVAGTYLGELTADSQNIGGKNISVTLARLTENRVRLTSRYERIGTVEVELWQYGNKIYSEGGDLNLIVNVDQNPATLEMSPRSEFAYFGTLRR